MGLEQQIIVAAVAAKNCNFSTIKIQCTNLQNRLLLYKYGVESFHINFISTFKNELTTCLKTTFKICVNNLIRCSKRWKCSNHDNVCNACHYKKLVCQTVHTQIRCFKKRHLIRFCTGFV